MCEGVYPGAVTVTVTESVTSPGPVSAIEAGLEVSVNRTNLKKHLIKTNIQAGVRGPCVSQGV